MAYHPETQAFYIPLNLTCENGTFGRGEARRRRRRLGPVRRTNLMHPESPDGLGELLAMDVNGEMWRHRTRTPPNTPRSRPAAASCVVGDWDRYFRVHDADTRKDPLPDAPADSVQGFPITYAVNGKQYLAVPVGTGGGSLVNQIVTDPIPEARIPQADEFDIRVCAAIVWWFVGRVLHFKTRPTLGQDQPTFRSCGRAVPCSSGRRACAAA